MFIESFQNYTGFVAEVIIFLYNTIVTWKDGIHEDM